VYPFLVSLSEENSRFMSFPPLLYYRPLFFVSPPKLTGPTTTADPAKSAYLFTFFPTSCDLFFSFSSLLWVASRSIFPSPCVATWAFDHSGCAWHVFSPCFFLPLVSSAGNGSPPFFFFPSPSCDPLLNYVRNLLFCTNLYLNVVLVIISLVFSFAHSSRVHPLFSASLFFPSFVVSFCASCRFRVCCDSFFFLPAGLARSFFFLPFPFSLSFFPLPPCNFHRFPLRIGSV